MGAYLSTARRGLLHGTLDALVLKTLSHGALHGYAIARWIEDRTSGAIQVEEGSLYPALYRLEDRKLIAATWGISSEGRRAKFYRLTARGKKQLDTERASWRMFTGAVGHVLDAD
jgi:transcriptional regulator